ncbi:MAG: hypothetical protein AB7F09_06640 [Parvibaculaceae bacterium]
MATLTIEGRKVKVSDDFLKLTPEEQADEVDEIAEHLGILPGSATAATADTRGGASGGLTRAGTRGVIKGAIKFGAAPADAREALAGGAQWLSDRLGFSPETAQEVASAIRAGFLVMPGGTGLPSADVIGGINDATRPAPNLSDMVTGQRPQAFLEEQPQTTGERYADTVGEFVGGSIFGPGSIGMRVLSGVTGGVASEAAGQATEGTPVEDAARFVAGLTGMGAPHLATGLRSAGSPAAQLDARNTAVKKLNQALEADAVTPQQITQLGPEGMLLDAGPNLRRQGRGIFATPGEGAEIIDQALERRAQGTTPRALQAADNAMGSRVNAVEHRERLMQARAGQGRPLYQAAFGDAKMVNTNPVLEAIDEIIQPNVTGMGPQSMSATGVRLKRYRNRLTMMNRGQVTDARALQGIYRDIGDDIGEALRKGRKGEASTLIGIKKRLEASIDEATDGGFSRANQQWATDSEILDAFGFGEDLARNSLTPDEVAARLKTMKPQARPQVILGLRNWIYEVVGTARNDAAAARALLQRGWTQEKLGMVLGKAKADELAKRIGLERTYAETDQFVRRGSNTTPGLSGMAEVADEPMFGAGNREAFAYGGFKGVARKKVLDWVEGATNRIARHRGDVTRADLAKMLTATGVDRDQIVNVLRSPEALEAFRGGAGIPSHVAINLLRTYAGVSPNNQLQGPDR